MGRLAVDRGLDKPFGHSYPNSLLMRVSYLKQMLFNPLEGKHGSLFSSQRELAQRVAALPNSSYDVGEEKALTSFINQIVNGKRRCPVALAYALRDAASAAAKAAGWSPQEIESLGRALMNLALVGDETEDKVSQLLEKQSDAEKVVIVNPFPVEDRGHPRSAEFQETMFQGILRDRPISYTFVLDEDRPTIAARFWAKTRDALKQFLLSSNTELNPGTILSNVNSKGILRIKMVARDLCIIPLVAFDPHNIDLCQAFVWDYWMDTNAQETNNVAHLSDPICQKWIRDFYEPLISFFDIKEFDDLKFPWRYEDGKV